MSKDEEMKIQKFIDSLDEFDIKKEDHPDDESQFFLTLSNFILDIIDLRRKNNISQKEVAERMGTKQASISRFENFNTNPKIEYLYKISKAVGGNMYLTPYGELTYTIPEKYRNEVVEAAGKKGVEVEEFIRRIFNKIIEFSIKIDFDRVLMNIEAMMQFNIESEKMENKYLVESLNLYKSSDMFSLGYKPLKGENEYVLGEFKK